MDPPSLHNTMSADDLVTKGARASTAIDLTEFFQIILSFKSNRRVKAK